MSSGRWGDLHVERDCLGGRVIVVGAAHQGYIRNHEQSSLGPGRLGQEPGQDAGCLGHALTVWNGTVSWPDLGLGAILLIRDGAQCRDHRVLDDPWHR